MPARTPRGPTEPRFGSHQAQPGPPNQPLHTPLPCLHGSLGSTAPDTMSSSDGKVTRLAPGRSLPSSAPVGPGLGSMVSPGHGGAGPGRSRRAAERGRALSVRLRTFALPPARQHQKILLKKNNTRTRRERAGLTELFIWFYSTFSRPQRAARGESAAANRHTRRGRCTFVTTRRNGHEDSN